MHRIILLVAHGSVERLEDIPSFLNEIRRGRPAPEELILELTERYRQVGGSPLMEHTLAQASALQERLGIETRVAMRLSAPRVSTTVADLGATDEIILVPIAPFSVAVYEKAAREELKRLPSSPTLRCIAPWGRHPALIEAYVSQIEIALQSCRTERTQVLLTAHSLPQSVIDAGDPYATQFEATAREVTEKLLSRQGNKHPQVTFCYQSQGAMKGAWLGPRLTDHVQKAAEQGMEHLVVSPIGFPAEHIETLYDLDIETKAEAEGSGLHLVRIPCLGSQNGLIEALAAGAQSLIRSDSEASY